MGRWERIRRWGAIILILASALALLGKFFDAAQGLNWMGRLMNDWGFSNVVALVLLALGLYVLAVNELWKPLSPSERRQRRNDLSSWRSPVEFMGYEHFLEHQGYSIAGCGLTPDEGFLRRSLVTVSGFRMLVRNKRSRPLKVKDAYIQSLHSGRKFPATFDDVPVGAVADLPPRSTVHLRVRFVPDEHAAMVGSHKIAAMPVGKFRQEFSNFVFVFEVEGYRHEERFLRDEIDHELYKIITGLEWNLVGGPLNVLPRSDTGSP